MVQSQLSEGPRECGEGGGKGNQGREQRRSLSHEEQKQRSN